MDENNYYEILKVNQNASKEEIKSSYKKLTSIHHPDKYKGSDVESNTQKYQKITEAYKVLSNKKRRELYDNKKDVTENNETNNDKYDKMIKSKDINELKTFDGRIHKNIIVNHEMTLKEMYYGKKAKIVYERKVKCIHKKEEKEECKDCKNKGIYTIKKSLSIPIKQGVYNGQQMLFQQKGNLIKENGVEKMRTDLIVIINQIENNTFIRKKNDLILNLSITIDEALFGFEKNIKTVNDEILFIKCEDPVKNGDLKKIVNYGMPDLNKNTYGDLIIKFDIKYPSNNIKLNSEDKNKIVEICDKLYVREKTELDKTNIVELINIKQDIYTTEYENEPIMDGGEQVQCRQQ